MTVVEFQDVTKAFRKSTVLEHISLSLHSGRIYGLQGINGSGKTMLMRVLSGLIYPTKGVVTINGKTLGGDITFPDSLGLLLENPSFLDSYSGAENLRMLASIQRRIGDTEIHEALSAVGLGPDDRKPYKKYSLGMKQRLGIAAAVMEKPDIVILDEPTNSLDTAGVGLVRQILAAQKARGALVVISCHDLSVLQELSDEIFQMETGRIVRHLLLDHPNEARPRGDGQDA